MSDGTVEQVGERLDGIYRTESCRIRATLTRLLGDFYLAEGAVRELGQSSCSHLQELLDRA